MSGHPIPDVASPPSPGPTDKEILTYIADQCRELRSLVLGGRFRLVGYLLDMVQLEASRAANGGK